MRRPYLYTVMHSGTRFVHNFLISIGADPKSLVHVGGDLPAGAVCVVPMRDPRLVFLSTYRRTGRMDAWRDVLGRVLEQWDTLAETLPDHEHVFLRVDSGDHQELLNVAEFLGATAPATYDWTPVGDYKDFPTTERTWDFVVQDWSPDQLAETAARLQPYRERYGYQSAVLE